MASCKKERPTIQQKEKLKNKHQNPLLGNALSGSTGFHQAHYKSTKNFLHKHAVCHISKEACQLFSPVAPYTKDVI